MKNVKKRILNHSLLLNTQIQYINQQDQLMANKTCCALLLVIFTVGASTSLGTFLHDYQKNPLHLDFMTQLAEEPQITNQEDDAAIQEADALADIHIGFVADQQFKGTFHSEQKQGLFDYLTVESGDILALLYKDELSRSALTIDRFVMILFNPVYHDQKAIRLEVQLGRMESLDSWSGNNSKAKISEFYKQRTQNEYNISDLNYTIRVKNIKSEDIEQVTLELHFEGHNFNLKADMTYNREGLSTFGYCFYVSFVVALQVVSLLMLLKRIEGVAPNVANKLSLTTVAVCNIQDFYLTMMHIEYIMTSASSSYLLYIFPSVAYIALFVIFDMKLLFLVWRAHYMREIDNPQALRKKLTTFYIKFYLGLFAYLTLTYFFSYDAWMIIIQNLILLPQIVHNARIGNNPGFEPLYVFGYLSARFFIPLYQRSCPSNHFLLTPMPGLVITLAILYALQILVLYLQFKLGPRFFIPKMLQPDYYDYNLKLRMSQDNKDNECSICLQSFFEDHSVQNMNTSSLGSTLLKEVNVMKTPCNHYYHRDCLMSWIDVKLECPSCRSPLPPI